MKDFKLQFFVFAIISDPNDKMLETIVNTLKSKTALVHFLLVLLIALAFCLILYAQILPLTYWMLFGEGAESERIESLPINIFFGNWSALFMVLIFIFIRLYANLRIYNLVRAKSYLLTGIIIVTTYLFRNQILDFLL
jgi:hypothetical protein